MKSLCTAIVILAKFLTVLGQLSIVFIDLPPTISSCPFLIQWTGGIPIYNVSISAGSSEATETLHDTYLAEKTQLLWDVDLPPNSAISIIVSDDIGSTPAIANSKIVADCLPPSPYDSPPSNASTGSSTVVSDKMKKAIVASIIIAFVLTAVLAVAVVFLYRRRRGTYPPASRAPALSGYSKSPAASRSMYAKTREAYLEREILALQGQINNFRRMTRPRASFEVSPSPSPIDENVEREILFLERQLDGLQEEMGDLREEREALHRLGCRSETASVIH